VDTRTAVERFRVDWLYNKMGLNENAQQPYAYPPPYPPQYPPNYVPPAAPPAVPEAGAAAPIADTTGAVADAPVAGGRSHHQI
jgi:hypothetical protein